jgi:hypothetical protein
MGEFAIFSNHRLTKFIDECRRDQNDVIALLLQTKFCNDLVADIRLLMMIDKNISVAPIGSSGALLTHC